MLSGGCFCGAVRYETDGTPFHETNCHCEICRRTSGAPMVAWFSVPKTGFRLVAGKPTRFRSTALGMRSFCPQCGTQLTFENDNLPDEIDVTIVSLDDPDRLTPKDHTYVRSRLQWVKLADQLPQYQETRREAHKK
ncbi:GFA family protein [Noviherbaspirillum malthae]|uniref:GFA family protein n=1 Tax=Noviherbaspirillum malthae TaxID=1260987 RepID=UPI00188FF2BA|nr:GFA family protein [Noviherbaspirillum malthae]